MYRSYSDVEGGRIQNLPQRVSLETNCNQVLSRAPTVTKEMLQKLQNDLGPKKSILCGYELNTRQISVLIALLILFLASCGGIFVMWGTNLYSDYILSLTVISNETDTFEDFVRPPPTFTKIYIFNYTNVADVEAGRADKLNVQELGPYTYRETSEKFNIEFSDDGNIVRYQERHKYEFMPEMSPGRMQFDRVVVPNIPLLAAAAMSQNSYFLTRMAMSRVFSTFNANPFLTLPVHEFVFGYDDDFYNLARGVLALTNPLPYERFGLLAGRKGVFKDAVEVYTGKDDITKLGLVKTLGAKSTFGPWLSEECNRISGVEGLLVPPNLARTRQPVDLLFRDLCRRYQYNFKEEVRVLKDTISMLRYEPPANVYDDVLGNPTNQAYCDMAGGCPPRGVYNATKCSFGTPMFISAPHFADADPKLKEVVTGLNPNPKNYRSFIDLHPTMGFITQGWNRLQMNVQVKKSFGITQLSVFNDDDIVPVAWFEVGGDLDLATEKVKQMVYDCTYVVQGFELAFKLTSLLMSIITFIAILLVIRGTFYNDINKSRLHRTETGQMRLI